MRKREKNQCDICNETFLSQRKLLFHKKQHEKNQLYDEFIAENFDLSCDLCDAEFTSFNDARQHYKASHNEDKGYLKCCGMKYRSFSLIRDHIKKHLNPESFKYVWLNHINHWNFAKKNFQLKEFQFYFRILQM